MKTHSPPPKSHESRRSVAAMLVLAFGALFLLSACHHGVYGQRYPHPHVATYHQHAPDYYGPARYEGETWHRPIRPDGNYRGHHHTTWGDLHCGAPRNYRLRVAW